jgi:hypothetical protein
MSTVRNWSFQSVDNVLDVTTLTSMHKSALLALKQRLVIAGWVVTSSSNSITANGSDNWNSTADLVNAVAASPHSWIVLRNGSVYLMLAYDDGNTFDITVKTNGAIFSGGTTSANPTTIGTPAGLNNYAWLTNILPVGARWHSTANTNGDLFFLVSLNGSGIAETAFGICSLMNGLTADPFPIYGFLRRQNGAAGMARDTLDTNNGLFGLWTSGNTISGEHYAGMPRSVTDSDSWLNSTGATNGIDPTLLDMFPVTIYSSGSGNPSVPRGQWPDTYLIKSSVSTRTQSPSASPIWTVVGSYAVPFTTLPTF